MFLQLTEAIPKAYDPNAWISIGPGLMSKLVVENLLRREESQSRVVLRLERKIQSDELTTAVTQYEDVPVYVANRRLFYPINHEVCTVHIAYLSVRLSLSYLQYLHICA